MKRAPQWIFGFILASAVFIATSGWAESSAKAKWSMRMQELYRTLADLLTDVTSDHRYNDPANRFRIQSEANHLSSLVHDLSKNTKEGATTMASVDSDPTLAIVSEMLARETKRAARELKRGNREYARSILRSVPSYCIACHTRNSSGPLFARLPLEPSNQYLSFLEKGEFFAASRQFDRAHEEFKKVIEKPTSSNFRILNWEEAVRQDLTIAVRVKKDPGRAQEIVDVILKSPQAPAFAKAEAKAWKKSIDEWKSETSRQPQTEEGLYSEALRLMARARETQRYPIDRTADVLYLRASSVVHDLFQLAPQGTHADEALLLAGLSYEVLNPLKTENMHEIFYEACVRKSPHTRTAELCYQRLESSVLLGYTGSAGTDVPVEARDRLVELKGLAAAVPKVQN